MFSGIVEAMGQVRRAEREGGALKLSLALPFDDLSLGESVAVNGVCLTVVEFGVGRADFFVSAETLARTNLRELGPADSVNLERAARLSDRMSGHLVQGHVDGEGRLVSVESAEGAWLIRLALPQSLRAYCVEKGSITLDGVSLTVNAVTEVGADGHFEIGITLIPHTWTHTTFHRRSVGAPVNVEVDVIAKYVERLCLPYLTR